MKDLNNELRDHMIQSYLNGLTENNSSNIPERTAGYVDGLAEAFRLIEVWIKK